MSLGKRWYFIPAKIAMDIEQKEGVVKILHQKEWIAMIPKEPAIDIKKRRKQKYIFQRVLYSGEAPYQSIKYEIKRINGDNGDFVGDKMIWLETKPHPKPEGIFYKKGCYENKKEEIFEKTYQKIMNQQYHDTISQNKPPVSPISSIASSSSRNTTPMPSPSCSATDSNDDESSLSSPSTQKRKASIFQRKNTFKKKKDEKNKKLKEQTDPIYNDPQTQTQLKMMQDLLKQYENKDIFSVDEALKYIGFFNEYKLIEREKWNVVVGAYQDRLSQISSKTSKSSPYSQRFISRKSSNNYNKNRKNDNADQSDDKHSKCSDSSDDEYGTKTRKNQQRYKCGECDKRFTEKCGLKEHERVHIGSKNTKKYDSDNSDDDTFEDPDYCVLCDKIIKTKDKSKNNDNKKNKKKSKKNPGDVARKHWAAKHKNNDTFKCPFTNCCNKTFPNVYTLKQHIKSQHSGFFKKDKLLPIDIKCKLCSNRCQAGLVVDQYKICCIKCNHKRVAKTDVEKSALNNNIYNDQEMLDLYPLYANCQKTSKQNEPQSMDIDSVNNTNLRLRSLSIEPSPPLNQQQIQQKNQQQSPVQHPPFGQFIQCGLCQGYFAKNVYLNHIQLCFANKN